jgi:hypothetical protein
MVIHISKCADGQPLQGATVTDIYGNHVSTDSFGNIQVPPGNEGNLYGTLITVAAYTYTTAEFTITSYDVNNFCLNVAPPTGTGTGGVY